MRTFKSLESAILYQSNACGAGSDTLLQTHQVFDSAENAESFKPNCSRSETLLIQKYVNPETKHESKNKFLVFIF